MMADIPFEISLDPTRRVLRAVLRGYWDVAMTRLYCRALTDRVLQLDRDAGTSWWVIDITDFDIQPAEVTSLMGVTLAGLMTGTEQVALVTPRALGALQASRTSARSHRRFGTVAEADAWIEQERAA